VHHVATADLLRALLGKEGRDRVEVRTFARDDGDRIRGCYTSHIAVLQEAAERLADSPSANVLVLEDNLAISPNLSGDVLRAVQLFCEGSADGASRRDMVHLAYIMYVPGLSVARTHADNIVQLKCNADSVRIRRINSENSPNDQREFAGAGTRHDGVHHHPLGPRRRISRAREQRLRVRRGDTECNGQTLPRRARPYARTVYG